MLTEQQIATYRNDGLVVPDYHIPEDALRRMRRLLVEMLRADEELSADYLGALTQHHPGWLEFAKLPPIVDAVTSLLGDDVALWTSTLFGKPARGGKATPWHQDGQYWPIKPLVTCSVWVALDDSDRDNGLPALHPRLAPVRDAVAARYLGQRSADAEPGARHRSLRRVHRSGRPARGRTDIDSRRVPDPRFAAQPFVAPSGGCRLSIHAHHVAFRSRLRVRASRDAGRARPVPTPALPAPGAGPVRAQRLLHRPRLTPGENQCLDTPDPSSS